MGRVAQDRKRRSRGSSAIEYIIMVTFVAITGIVGYGHLGTKYKCKIQQATALFSDGTSAECQDAPGVGGDGPGSGGSGSGSSGGPTVSGTCVGDSCSAGGGGGKQCFVAGTDVATPDGSQPIESLVVGDAVLSRDPETGEMVVGRVAQTFVHDDAALVELHLAEAPSHGLRATPTHPFFTADRGWVEAGDLRPNEELVDASGAPLHVAFVTALAEHATVYNFEVTGTHTYFAGPDLVWVHNACQNLPPGTTLYHGTNDGAAYSIITGGIQDVPNAWGGGELGSGFYTTTQQGAAGDYANGGPILVFQTGQTANGQSTNNTWDNYKPPSGNPDFETLGSEGDDPAQYKFGPGKGAPILGRPKYVLVPDGHGGYKQMTPKEYLESIGMYDSDDDLEGE
jgi:hypothetical protein